MFTKEQLLNAYTQFVRDSRELPEDNLSDEERDELTPEQEAAIAVDILVATMEGR